MNPDTSRGVVCLMRAVCARRPLEEGDIVATNKTLDDIAAQLRHFTLEEVIALVGDFLAGLDEAQRARFRELVGRGPRPLVAETMGLDDAGDLLAAIQELHDDLANDKYVEYGAGYDPEYGDYRGFGDDSWIEEMDDLFGAATSLFRAGRFQAAAEAYLALFHVFDLGEDGYHFTRPDPVEALRSDVDAMKVNLFIAIGRSAGGPAAAAERALEVSEDIGWHGTNRYALLDAWQSRPELLAGLEAALVEQAAAQAVSHAHVLPHEADLLRELFRRHRALPDYAALCRRVGALQGWPYEDLVNRYRQQEDWDQVRAWGEDALQHVPAASPSRPALQEAHGEALLRLGRPVEAVDTLRSLFRQQREVSVYLKLREAAQAIGRWAALYGELTAELRQYVLAATRDQSSYSAGALLVAGWLGFAYLLEGAWQAAIEWAANPALPPGWQNEDRSRIVATGLLRMGLAAPPRGAPGRTDDTLTEELQDAPAVIREHGVMLEAAAGSLDRDRLLDSAVQVYEHLVTRAAAGRARPSYAQAGACCKVIRSIRRLQGREVEFERYYQGLFVTYSRYAALKDELRKAVEGSGDRRTRRR
ncbi:MAG: hypothetical protein HY332_13620 [Chloroflexi bacterium]|nr:hypothetical protein [Chloroflexota bacterium]